MTTDKSTVETLFAKAGIEFETEPLQHGLTQITSGTKQMRILYLFASKTENLLEMTMIQCIDVESIKKWRIK